MKGGIFLKSLVFGKDKLDEMVNSSNNKFYLDTNVLVQYFYQEILDKYHPNEGNGSEYKYHKENLKRQQHVRKLLEIFKYKPKLLHISTHTLNEFQDTIVVKWLKTIVEELRITYEGSKKENWKELEDEHFGDIGITFAELSDKLISEFVNDFKPTIIDIPNNLFYKTNIYIKEHGIPPKDARHLAIMHKYKINNIITLDGGFIRSPNINIYTTNGLKYKWIKDNQSLSSISTLNYVEVIPPKNSLDFIKISGLGYENEGDKITFYWTHLPGVISYKLQIGNYSKGLQVIKEYNLKHDCHKVPFKNSNIIGKNLFFIVIGVTLFGELHSDIHQIKI
jgi:predicted nucleic acid-binding protein